MDLISVLLVEDNIVDAKRVLALLKYMNQGLGRVEHAPTMASALAALDTLMPDIILLDPGLPDSDANSVSVITHRAPHVPIVVLTGHDDPVTGLRVIQSGAQEYLPKSEMTSDLLERAISFAIERKRSQRTKQTFYRDSVALLAPDVVDAVETQQAVTSWEVAMARIYDLVSMYAPDLKPEVDSVLNEYAPKPPTRIPSQQNLQSPVMVAAKATLSSVTDRAPPSAALASDPREYLADVLSRYKPTKGDGRGPSR